MAHTAAAAAACRCVHWQAGWLALLRHPPIKLELHGTKPFSSWGTQQALLQQRYEVLASSSVCFANKTQS
jgi:hypothetical protein